jgi:tripartite-type tricarboxylate transporter receptor subunit TctC
MLHARKKRVTSTGGFVPIRKLVFSLLLAGPMAFIASPASGQDFPTRPIRIVTSEIGGLNDFTARMIAQSMAGSIGQPVIVDNRGRVAIDITAQAAPDGYTLVSYANNFWLFPFIEKSYRFDPVRDFSPVTLAVSAPNVLVIHPTVQAKSVRDFIALAKAQPGALNYGAGATGGTPHLAAELFKSMAGVNIVRISFKGTGPAITGLLGGEVQMAFATPGTVNSHIQAGRLRALGVTSLKPTSLAPGLPTLASEGLPGYEAIAVTALFGPAKMPAKIVDKLSQEMAKAMNQPATKEQFMKGGADVVASSPPELGRFMKSEMQKWEKIVRAALAE